MILNYYVWFFWTQLILQCFVLFYQAFLIIELPDIYAENQLWQQNIWNLMKIFIMYVFQIAEADWMKLI